MIRFRPAALTLLTALFLPAFSGAVAAEETPVEAPNPPAAKLGNLDIIPADAGAAFAIRNLQDLKTKGDTFIDETQMKVFLRPSQLFDMGLQWIGIKQGVDDQAAMALLLVNFKSVGVENVEANNFEKTLVLVIPFTDRDKIASNFSLKAADLQPGKIVKTNKKKNAFDLRGYVAIRGKHLLMSANDEAIAAVLKAKPLRRSLKKQQQHVLDQADMLLHIGPRSWGKDWERVLTEIEKGINVEDGSPEARLVRELGQAIRQLRFGMIAVRIDGGLGLNVITLFDDEGAARKVLTQLAGGPKPSNLNGLPRGDVLAIQAARGDGEQNVAIARAMMELALRNSSLTKPFISAAHRPNFVGVFGEVWQHLKGSRYAVYKNEDEAAMGLLNMVAILDTDDPARFLGEMRELATFINSAGLKLTDGTTDGIDSKTVKQLIRDLGNNRFRVRRSATLKLSLVGEPALPLLEAATKSTDLEVATRAKRLTQQIKTRAATRRKDLLGDDLLSSVKPKFAYFPKAEVRAKTIIDIVNVRLSGRDEAYAKQLRQLLGPDWAKIRVATHRNHVVVLFGSDTKLLEQALLNVKQNKAGLAESPLLREFSRRRDAGRKVEMHLSLAKAKRLISPPADKQPPAKKSADEISSFALTIAPARIQLDVFIPFSEAKVFLKDQNW